MWIRCKDKNNLVNLAHACEVQYDRTREQLSVWWAFPLPSGNDECFIYTVEPDEWARFCLKGRE